ncbi:sulfatase domain-containing protein [Metarhizium rileyi]|uniref:Sulfatase domain-containing protein n=1 Tax=Metarhizium rileyi (strain RCEF 4871) TaxID=1649241 RepID=A0A166ZQC8_METRR|nr:sulfatase domain-containing protein [Metarhizium rileyi RCEF 4871]
MFPSARRLIFSVFFVSVALAKVVRLYINAHSFSLGTFVLCLPIFLIPDALVLLAVWSLLQHRRGRMAILGSILSCIVSVSTYVAAAALFSFFYETGGELQWADAVSFALDPGARKVASSGSSMAMIACIGILVVAFIIQDLLHSAVVAVLVKTRIQLDLILQVTMDRLVPKQPVDQKRSLLPTVNSLPVGDECAKELSGQKRRRFPVKSNASSPPGHLTLGQLIYWYMGTSLLGSLACVLILEPARPYAHISMTLPLSLLSLIKLGTPVRDCQDKTWPLPELVTRAVWERPDGYFKGWAPGLDNEFVRKYRGRIPEWLPPSPPAGFYRWQSQWNLTTDNTTTMSMISEPQGLVDSPSNTSDMSNTCEESALEGHHYYNPVNDPIKINNLDGPVLSGLRSSLGLDSVNIKHIVIIQMESMRPEVSPIQNDSNFHKMILQSHDESEYDDINLRLAGLTVNMQKITGVKGGFQTADGTPLSSDSNEWLDRTEASFGGLNIVGTHTTCSSSIKSLAANHCGVWPLPVDSCEESSLQNYQPCLPQVFQLLNTNKATSNTSDYRTFPWRSAFFQSITDGFDNQGEMDDKIGFEHIVTSDQIDDLIDKGESDEEEVNYFGYAETAIKSYIRDYIINATENNQRMFLSHFTSTTHHPWSIPSWFNKTDYLGLAQGGLSAAHHDMNNYLNTIRWNDAWVGELMQLLDDLGVSDETLVVFVGDHGQAFREDSKVSGTYQNGHISNFRVPLTFRHPSIPSLQLAVNSTSINILPTVLDLLISSGSLDAHDTDVLSDIVHDYEGQSLIRPFKSTLHGRRAWNFGVVNPGGRFLAVTSADVPWRIVRPWDDDAEYVFTDLERDPLELDGLSNWSFEELLSDVEQYFGMDAATWVREADSVARWWGMERRRLWQYYED